MALGDVRVVPKLQAYAQIGSQIDTDGSPAKPRRTAPFEQEPGYHAPAGLWLYGNARLLEGQLGFVSQALGRPDHTMNELDEIERLAEELVLAGKIIVCGVHNFVHQRVAVVPLRWGSPRIVVLSGGFRVHLGDKLKHEPFRAARLWRYEWDSATDLAISRRDPDKQPTFARTNPTLDRMIERIASSSWPGLRTMNNGELRVLV